MTIILAEYRRIEPGSATPDPGLTESGSIQMYGISPTWEKLSEMMGRLGNVDVWRFLSNRFMPKRGPDTSMPSRERVVDRVTGSFLIASKDHSYAHAIQCARLIESLERIERDDIATLHIDDSRSTRFIVWLWLKPLEGAVLFEDRIEVAD